MSGTGIYVVGFLCSLWLFTTAWGAGTRELVFCTGRWDVSGKMV